MAADADDFSSLFEFLPIGAYRAAPDRRIEWKLSLMSNRLHVGNLSCETTKAALTSRFGADGRTVANVEIFMGRDGGKTRGFAFVGRPARVARLRQLRENDLRVDRHRPRRDQELADPGQEVLEVAFAAPGVERAEGKPAEVLRRQLA